MLHHVRPTRPTAFGRTSCARLRGTEITPHELRKVLAQAPIVPLEAVLDALAADRDPPEGQVLTFDDGYAGWTEIAEALPGPATFFGCVALHAEGVPHPVDAYYWLLDHAEVERFNVVLPDGTVWTGDLASDEGKRALVFGGPKPFVVEPSTAHEMLARVSSAVGVKLPDGLARRLYLDEAGWRRLRRTGHSVGAHGVRHVHLTRLDDDALEAELRTSLAWARAFGGHAFAYPDGAVDERVADATRRAGASCGLTCIPGAVVRGADRFLLPRIFIQGEDVSCAS